MVTAAFVLALVLLTMLFGRHLERQRNPNVRPVSVGGVDGTIEVRLAANRAGHYLAGGSLNGLEVVYLLDTGATTIAVPGRVADRAGLSRGQALTVSTAAGPSRAYYTRIDSAELGGIRLENLVAVIIPSMDGDEVLLGMNFLGALDFSQRGDTLILRQAAGGAGRVQ